MTTQSSLFALLLLSLLMADAAGASAQTPAAPTSSSTPVISSSANAPAGPATAPVDAWPGIPRYHKLNAAVTSPKPGEKRVVFFGDSITDKWARDKSFFPGKPYIGRGISGQTTMQMLVRFRQDVIDLQPQAVVILAGTNDIAQNQGPTSLGLIEDDLRSMAELAVANHIQPILCSILPASDYRWRPGLQPGPKIVEVNHWIENYCKEQHLVFVNYYLALVDDKLGMRAELSGDGVHPTPAGYAIMAPMAEAAIHQAVP